MSTFIISFRVGSEGDYSQRYQTMMARIFAISTTNTWEETTSFVLIDSPRSAEDIATDIYVNSDMNSKFDTLLVIDLDNGLHATRGVVKYPNTLAGFFKKSLANALAGLGRALG